MFEFISELPGWEKSALMLCAIIFSFLALMSFRENQGPKKANTLADQAEDIASTLAKKEDQWINDLEQMIALLQYKLNELDKLPKCVKTLHARKQGMDSLENAERTLDMLVKRRDRGYAEARKENAASLYEGRM